MNPDDLCQSTSPSGVTAERGREIHALTVGIRGAGSVPGM